MKRSSKHSESSRNARVDEPVSLWRGLALVALVALVYAQTLGYGWVWDDDVYVERNATLRTADGLADIWLRPSATPQYYPLVHTSFWIEHRLWGESPIGYHATNVVLHALNVLLVWRLLSMLSMSGAWLAAALFAVHPVEVESVAWVTERKNVLSCALALGSILAFLRWSPVDPLVATSPGKSKQSTWQWYALSLALFVGALLSKTVTASVPAVLIVIYWWKRGSSGRRELAALVPFFIVGVALAAVTVHLEATHVGASGEEWDLTVVERVLIAGRALWFYAWKLAWPYPLVFFYPRWTIDTSAAWQYLYSLAALAVIVALWFARGRLGRGPLAAVLIFAGVLVPALGFVNVYPFRFSFVADHFQYHASIALLALAAAGLAIFGKQRQIQNTWIVPLGIFGILAPMALLAHEQAGTYESLDVFYRSILAKNPESWIAEQNLGRDLHRQKDYVGAIEHYQRAIALHERLAKETPNAAAHRAALAECRVNLAFTRARVGQLAEAIEEVRQAITIRELLLRDRPEDESLEQDLAGSYIDIAVWQDQLNEPERATKSFAAALAIRKRIAAAHPADQQAAVRLSQLYSTMAICKQIGGQLANAEAAQLQAIAVLRKIADEQPEEAANKSILAQNLVTLADIQLNAQKPEAAQVSLREAIVLHRRAIERQPEDEYLRMGLAGAEARLAQVEAQLKDR